MRVATSTLEVMGLATTTFKRMMIATSSWTKWGWLTFFAIYGCIVHVCTEIERGVQLCSLYMDEDGHLHLEKCC
jgi:hypothetical protein